MLLASLAPRAKILTDAFDVTPSSPIQLVRRLAELGTMAGSPNPPERAWLNPVVLSALDEAKRLLAELLFTYRSRRDALRATFTDDVR